MVQPPEINHRELKKAKAKIITLEGELAELGRAAAVAGAKIAAAEAHDRQALEDAKFDGRPVPEPTAPNRADAERATRAEETALTGALVRAKAALEEARVDHQVELLRSTGRDREKADTAYQKVVAAVAVAEGDLAACEFAEEWVKKGEALKVAPRAFVPAVADEGNEGRTPVAPLIEALAAREVGLRPKPKGQPAYVGKPMRLADGTPIRPRGGEFLSNQGIPTGITEPLIQKAKAEPMVETFSGPEAA